MHQVYQVYQVYAKYTKSPAEREKQSKLLGSQNYHRPWSAKDYMLYVCIRSKNLKGLCIMLSPVECVRCTDRILLRASSLSAVRCAPMRCHKNVCVSVLLKCLEGLRTCLVFSNLRDGQKEKGEASELAGNRRCCVAGFSITKRHRTVSTIFKNSKKRKINLTRHSSESSPARHRQETSSTFNLHVDHRPIS